MGSATGIDWLNAKDSSTPPPFITSMVLPDFRTLYGMLAVLLGANGWPE